MIEETSRPRKSLLFFWQSASSTKNCVEDTKKPPYGEIRRKKGVCVVAADWGSPQHYQLSDASERGESDAGVFKFWCSTSSCNLIVHNGFKENISNYLRII